MLAVTAPTFRLPLDLAKLVERRRRTRVDRSRLIANNAELQRSILDTTRMYNMESERRRAINALETSMGPSLARVTREVRGGVVLPISEPTILPTAVPQTPAQAVALAHIRRLDQEHAVMLARRVANPSPLDRNLNTRNIRLGHGQSRLG
jgi:hypothetical protein